MKGKKMKSLSLILITLFIYILTYNLKAQDMQFKLCNILDTCPSGFSVINENTNLFRITSSGRTTFNFPSSNGSGVYFAIKKGNNYVLDLYSPLNQPYTKFEIGAETDMYGPLYINSTLNGTLLDVRSNGNQIFNVACNGTNCGAIVNGSLNVNNGFVNINPGFNTGFNYYGGSTNIFSVTAREANFTVTDFNFYGHLDLHGTSSLFDNVYINASGCYTGTWGQCSDVRFKKNINLIPNALNKILNLKGVSFEWKKDEFPQKNFEVGTKLGFVAQDMEKVLPELVKTEADGYKSISYSNLTPVIIEAMKEQQEIIRSQELKLSELNSKINSLENKLLEQEKKINSILKAVNKEEKK